MNSWLALAVAVSAEIAATSALAVSQGFTRALPTGLAVAGYGLAFYSLAIALRAIPLGLAYAIWSGAGIVVLSVVGWFFLKQPLSAQQCAGLGLIALGIALLRLPNFPTH